MDKKIILRKLVSPYNFDLTKGSVLTHDELDSNFINLKGFSIKGATLSGTTLQLNRVDGVDINIDMSTFTPTKPDNYVTGGTYDNNTGVISFGDELGNSFNVGGFVTGFTDTKIVSGVYINETLTITNSDNSSISISGFPGAISGPKGDIGLQGPVGPQGVMGVQGLKGDNGSQGIQGVQGIKGDTGPQGVQGIKGDTGSAGAQGIQGLKGETGDAGAQGIQGLKGETGDAGAVGAQGVQGPKGDTGAQGVQGLKGDKGDAGAQGVQGLKGDKGDAGAVGAQGVQGAQGVSGATGERGLGYYNLVIKQATDSTILPASKSDFAQYIRNVKGFTYDVDDINEVKVVGADIFVSLNEDFKIIKSDLTSSNKIVEFLDYDSKCKILGIGAFEGVTSCTKFIARGIEVMENEAFKASNKNMIRNFDFPNLHTIGENVFLNSTGGLLSFEVPLLSSLKDTSFINANIITANLKLPNIVDIRLTKEDFRYQTLYAPKILEFKEGDVISVICSTVFLPSLRKFSRSAFFECNVTDFDLPSVIEISGTGIAFKSSVTRVNIPNCIKLGASHSINSSYFDSRASGVQSVNTPFVVNINKSVKFANNGLLSHTLVSDFASGLSLTINFVGESYQTDASFVGLDLKDKNDISQFKTGDYLKLKGGTFDISDKSWTSDPGTAFTMYIHNLAVPGLSEPNNPNKPYRNITEASIAYRNLTTISGVASNNIEHSEVIYKILTSSSGTIFIDAPLVRNVSGIRQDVTIDSHIDVQIRNVSSDQSQAFNPLSHDGTPSANINGVFKLKGSRVSIIGNVRIGSSFYKHEIDVYSLTFTDRRQLFYGNHNHLLGSSNSTINCKILTAKGATHFTFANHNNCRFNIQNIIIDDDGTQPLGPEGVPVPLFITSGSQTFYNSSTLNFELVKSNTKFSLGYLGVINHGNVLSDGYTGSSFGYIEFRNNGVVNYKDDAVIDMPVFIYRRFTHVSLNGKSVKYTNAGMNFLLNDNNAVGADKDKMFVTINVDHLNVNGSILRNNTRGSGGIRLYNSTITTTKPLNTGFLSTTDVNIYNTNYGTNSNVLLEVNGTCYINTTAPNTNGNAFSEIIYNALHYNPSNSPVDNNYSPSQCVINGELIIVGGVIPPQVTIVKPSGTKTVY